MDMSKTQKQLFSLNNISAKETHSSCIHVIYNLSGNQGVPSWDNHNGR